jgi:hypothetical protein
MNIDPSPENYGDPARKNSAAREAKTTGTSKEENRTFDCSGARRVFETIRSVVCFLWTYLTNGGRHNDAE